MFVIGVILLAAGLVMTLLEFTGFVSLIPALDDLTVPLGVWVGVAVIGAILTMLYRRTHD
jgi:nitrate reductase gamma subunit